MLSASRDRECVRRRLGLLGMLAIVALTSASTGCTTMHNGFEAITNNGGWNDTVLVLRNRSYSAKAWHRRKHNFCREKYSKDFCAGFRAGFEAVADGSDGCTPAFPPQEYWSWEYQSAEGQGKTSAWMAGFPHGARAAEEDGVANWTQIQMAPAYQSQYQQNGVFENRESLYPIPDAENQGVFPSAVAPGEVLQGMPEAVGPAPSGMNPILSPPSTAAPFLNPGE